ncbi:hypothetical protein HYV88_02925 [Candidatus Woesearchaeota archaeon]|nr:hypothetical protein [Candidatus Woesearchaeota archaeon]
MTDFLPIGTFYANLSGAQRRAILYAIEKGLELRNSCPWIADEFRQGKSISALAQDERIKKSFNGSIKTLYRALSLALGGYNREVSFSEIQQYSGLIPNEEYLSLIQEHNKQSTNEWNKQMQERGIGLAAMTRKQRQEIGRRSGLKQLENKIGIHAQTLEERKLIIKKALVAQGKTPWENDEMKHCYELSLQERFRKSSRVNWEDIAVSVNQKYHAGKSLRDNRAVAKAAKKWEERNMPKQERENSSLLEQYIGEEDG